MAEAADRDLLWKQYSLHVDLYKFYIESVIKLNAFHYAITGAIVSVYLAKLRETPLIKWSLILPIGLSFGFMILFVYGTKLNKAMRQDVFNIRDTLGLDAGAEVRVLSVLLWIFAVAHILTVLGLVIAMCAF